MNTEMALSSGISVNTKSTAPDGEAYKLYPSGRTEQNIRSELDDFKRFVIFIEYILRRAFEILWITSQISFFQ